jgi:hypothetical protein
VQDIAKSTIDQSMWVVYTHVFPFEYATWIRPFDEWTDGRFRKITSEEYEELLKCDKIQFQNAITAAKKAAKG